MILIKENTDNETIDPIKELSDARMSLFAVMYALKDRQAETLCHCSGRERKRAFTRVLF